MQQKELDLAAQALDKKLREFVSNKNANYQNRLYALEDIAISKDQDIRDELER